MHTKGLLRAEEITETRKSFTNKPIMRVSECTHLCTPLGVYMYSVSEKSPFITCSSFRENYGEY